MKVGQLRKLELNVDYNPEHEEKTQVTGDAEFNVPARAGLRAFVSGGILEAGAAAGCRPGCARPADAGLFPRLFAQAG